MLTKNGRFWRTRENSVCQNNNMLFYIKKYRQQKRVLGYCRLSDMGCISEYIMQKGEMQMKQRFLGRRIISIVLTIAMVFSLLSINSMPVRAEGNDPPSGSEEACGHERAASMHSLPWSGSQNAFPLHTAGKCRPDTARLLRKA